jgi:hypothetical protein
LSFVVTSVLVLGAIWVVVGIPAIIAIAREKRSPDLTFARAMDALGTQSPSASMHLGVSLATRRAQVLGVFYAGACTMFAVGAATESQGVLGAGVVLANLGTFYRLTVLRMRAMSAQRQVPAPLHAPRANGSPAGSFVRIPPTTLGPAMERIPDRADDERVVIIG